VTIWTSAADPVTNGSTALLAAVVPFVSAIVLLLISPLLAKKIKATIRGQIAVENDSLHVRENSPDRIRPEGIDTYIEYAADAVQIFPLTLLPVTGAVFAIAIHVPSAIALGYLGLAVVAALAVDAWVLSQPAGKYVTRRLSGYSASTAIGIVSNLLGLTMILIYGA
jgi:hypothetical protein